MAVAYIPAKIGKELSYAFNLLILRGALYCHAKTIVACYHGKAWLVVKSSCFAAFVM